MSKLLHSSAVLSCGDGHHQYTNYKKKLKNMELVNISQKTERLHFFFTQHKLDDIHQTSQVENRFPCFSTFSSRSQPNPTTIPHEVPPACLVQSFLTAPARQPQTLPAQSKKNRKIYITSLQFCRSKINK